MALKGFVFGGWVRGKVTTISQFCINLGWAINTIMGISFFMDF
jgi:hypothetical protein